MSDKKTPYMSFPSNYLDSNTEQRTECTFPGCGGTPGHNKTYCPECKQLTRPKIATKPKDREKYI